MKLEEHSAYIKSFNLSNYVWEVAKNFDWFVKKTIGSQFVRAVDSISANLAEGWHRYYKKDKIVFYIIARASASESLDWARKCKIRKLITEKQFLSISNILEELPKDINGLIKSTKDNLEK